MNLFARILALPSDLGSKSTDPKEASPQKSAGWQGDLAALQAEQTEPDAYMQDVGRAWSASNADFEASEPTMAGRIWRGISPLTGFGSAVGAMHDAAGKGSAGEMALAATQAVPTLAATRAAKGAAGPVIERLAGKTARRAGYGGSYGATVDKVQDLTKAQPEATADDLPGILALPSRLKGWDGEAPERPAGGAMAAISYKDPAWDASEAAASQQTGVPVQVLRAIRLHGERSNGNQVSPKGAQGVYQFIPSTRNAFMKKYGVDAYSPNPDEQALATALHLKESYARTKDWTRAMAGFNGGISAERGTNKTAENAGYVRRTSAAITGLPGAAPDEFADAWQRDAFANTPTPF